MVKICVEMLSYVVFCVAVLQGVDAVCSSSRVNCKTNNTYTFCVDLGYTTVKLESVNLKCPDGLFCSENHYYPCVPESEVPPIGGLPEPVTTTTPSPIIITATQKTIIPNTTPTSTQTETLIPQSTTQLIHITTTPTSVSTINSTDAVPSTPNPSTLNPSVPNNTTQPPTTTPIIIHTTITTISIINSTTAVPPITNSTLPAPSTTNPPTTIPSTQSQFTTSIGDNKTAIVTTTAPVVTASSPVTTTQVPTLPPCPNPPPSGKPVCTKSGTTSPGPVCTRFYECVPMWFRLEAEEKICARGRAYSASQKKCVIPPDGCVCAN